jgi:hypothetical protein
VVCTITPVGLLRHCCALCLLLLTVLPHVGAVVLHRYLHAAFTVRGAKQSAKHAHEWRQRFGVDGAVQRPVPYHTAVTTAFPTYVLMEESPEGHAVIYSRVGGYRVAASCPHDAYW